MYHISSVRMLRPRSKLIQVPVNWSTRLFQMQCRAGRADREHRIMVSSDASTLRHRLTDVISAPPTPNLMSTGQPLSIPTSNFLGPAAADVMNVFPKDPFLIRGRKRPSAEHREEPPTSRLRRELSQEPTSQQNPYDGTQRLNQGSASEARFRPGDGGNRGGGEQAFEIPGVTTMISHVSLEYSRSHRALTGGLPISCHPINARHGSTGVTGNWSS